MGHGQSMTTSRRPLEPAMPSGEPSNANDKQYKPSLHSRRCRAGAKARGKNEPRKAKKPHAKNGASEGSMPRDVLPRDCRGRFVATKGGGGGGGRRRGAGGGACVNQYESILNLQAPDVTTLLGIMNGGRSGANGSGAKRYRDIARLHDFTSVLDAMNSISYKAADHGQGYDVLKVLLQADGETTGW